jgi:hypothetical protein
MKAIDAVKNLRTLADLLEEHGEAEIRMSAATVWFGDKESFLSIARDLPRPIAKEWEEGPYGDLKLTHGILNKTGNINLYIRRSIICEIVEPARPAVYNCPSIFSPEEEVEMGQA